MFVTTRRRKAAFIHKWENMLIFDVMYVKPMIYDMLGENILDLYKFYNFIENPLFRLRLRLTQIKSFKTPFNQIVKFVSFLSHFVRKNSLMQAFVSFSRHDTKLRCVMNEHRPPNSYQKLLDIIR